MKKRSFFVVMIALTILSCVLVVTAGKYAEEGAAEAKAAAEAEAAKEAEARKNVVLELSYADVGETVTTESTIRFNGDRTFTCKGLASSMYAFEYKTSYDAQNGLQIETKKEYTSKGIEEALPVLDVMGLPHELTFNVVHIVEDNGSQGLTLTIQTEAGDTDPTILGIFEISADQLEELAEATAAVEEPVIKDE